MHIYHLLSTHSSIHGHSGCFHLLTIVNNAIMNTGVEMSVCICAFHSFGNIPRSEVPGSSYGNYVYFFFNNCHTVFHSSCSILHSHWQCTSVHIYPYPHQHLFSVFSFLNSSRPNESEVSSMGVNHLTVG